MKFSISILVFAMALSAAPARAVIILAEENFTRTDGSAVRATAVSPVAGPADWGGSPGFSAENNALRSAAGNAGHVLTIDFGVDYFITNPGIYTLASDVFFESNALSDASTRNWQIGFNNATNSSAGANRTLLSTDTFGGAPGLILSADGVAQVKTVNSAAPSLQTPIGTYASGSVYNLKLVLDTQPTNWTVDAFIDNVALDINGVSPGTTFTYATNPTIRYVTISSSIRAVDNADFNNYLDNFQLVVVPEPSTLALTGMAALVLFRRRRL